MNGTTPSDAAIEDLLRGGKLSSGKVGVGPLGTKAAQLLRILRDHRESLLKTRGSDQADALRRLFLAHTARNEAARGAETSPDAGAADLEAVTHEAESVDSLPPKVGWRLHLVCCRSIRGIAQIETPFEFSFDGWSTLLFGPNGSGKSSLLNAIVWVLTGRIVTDASDYVAEIPLYAPLKPGKRHEKLRDWPVVHTLPHGDSPLVHEFDCWASLMMRSEDGTRMLHLRRTLQTGLEESDDGVMWRPCPTLGTHGITPLDIQLSVSAATVFGRRSVEESADTRHLLSMMLGYDMLEELGDFVTTLATNLTKAAKSERGSLTARATNLRLKLTNLPTILRDGHSLRASITSLSTEELPSPDRIREVQTQAEAALEAAERELASLLEMRVEGAPAPSGLADALTSAVTFLAKPIVELFPALGMLHPATILEVTPGDSIIESMATSLAALSTFEEQAVLRIRDRLTWWRKESAEGSKAALLIQAAVYYDPAGHLCPVCDQSIFEMPISSELAALKGASVELRAGLREFFRDLVEGVNNVVAVRVQSLGEKGPAQRLLEDWHRLKRSLGAALAPVVDRYESLVSDLLATIPVIVASDTDIMPADTEPEFSDEAATLFAVLKAARQGYAIVAWAAAHLTAVSDGLNTCLTVIGGDGPPSLLAALSRGKDAAADGIPLASTRNSLSEAAKETAAIGAATLASKTLEEIHAALAEIKPLGKYAGGEVERIFDQIIDNTINNYRKLYPHANPTLAPSRLHLNKGRDKTVEAFLGGDSFEVPGRHVSNAGLQRAVALAFYFALLERHPGGLGFVIMDDPILSLDDDHREAFAANILRPTLAKTQVILASHQRQFLNNCRTDFCPGRLIELNPRTRSTCITWRPGDRLDRAEEMLLSDWTCAPNLMRKYFEDLLITLDAFSPTVFFNRANLAGSVDAYANLPPGNPLIGNNRDKIVRRLCDEKVSRVLNPGSHALTEADVTEPMASECLRELRDLDKTFRNELERLEDLRLRELRNKALGASAISSSFLTATGSPPLKPVDRLRIEGSTWREPIRLRVIGTAAARTHGCVVDIAEMPEDAEFPSGTAVLVAGESLSPIARPGQWALLAEEEVHVDNGDLVAVLDVAGNRYLRRAWSDGDIWILEAINPSSSIAATCVRKCECVLRRVRGISYGPEKAPRAGNGRHVLEWSPREDFVVDSIAKYHGITISGTSLEPIANHGQIVLVNRKITGRFDAVRKGTLAVVETSDDAVGNIIKRVFPHTHHWLLLSPNPIEPRDPIVVAKNAIQGVWNVEGVLFGVL